MAKPFINITISPRDNYPEGQMFASVQWGRYTGNGLTRVIDMEYFLECVTVPRPNSKPYKQWVADVVNCTALANHAHAYGRREPHTIEDLDARRAGGAEM